MPTFETRTAVKFARNIRLFFHLEAGLTGLGVTIQRLIRSRLGKPMASPSSQIPAPTQQTAHEQLKKPLQDRCTKLVEQRREPEQARQQLATKDQEQEQTRQQLKIKSQELEEHNQLAKMRQEYRQLAKAFHEKVLEMGYEDIGKFFWYHTIDLGDSLITPGAYDYRPSLPAFKFPAEMEGMNVLDVGSATGFFAFEFERRGANVTSVELPASIDGGMAADTFPEETEQQVLKKLERVIGRCEERTEVRSHLLQTGTLEELHYFDLDGPFKFCHKLLDSKVQRCYSSIYDLSKESLGRDDFDLVFLGDVLVHTIDPLKALAAVTPLCRGTLIISQDLPDGPQPAMLYIGSDKLGEDQSAWWLPNRLCFEQILKKLGFKNFAVVGAHSGFTRPEGDPYKRAIIHAKR